MALPDEADRLYELPLTEFTVARNELAAQLRKQGNRAGSEAVKALPKPSITAWALNQVSRRQPKAVQHLLEAGDRLARAQQALLAGRGQPAFREATQHQRETVAKVIQAAAAVLGTAGHVAGKAVLDRLEATARAAAADAEAGQQLLAGRLAADLDPTGFGAIGGEVFGLPAKPIPFPRERMKPPPAPQPAQDKRVARLNEAREEVQRLQKELKLLREEAAELESVAARARQAAAKARNALIEARAAVARAEKAVEHARKAEENAARELAAVRAQLDQRADALEDAQNKLRELRSAS